MAKANLASDPFALRNQVWADTLRLPCFITPPAALLTEIATLRQSPIPFQSKHLPALKRDVWYALKRPSDRSRMGALCIWPAQKCCVYVSGDQTPRVALLRLRVDPQFMADGMGMTVFAATLSAGSRRLWLEDVLLWKGRNVWAEEPFKARWNLAAQWLEHYCILDERLLGGLELALGRWSALADVKPEGVWIFQSEEAGRRGFLWIANTRAMDAPALTITSNAPMFSDRSVPSPRPTFTAPTLEVGPLIAQASRESGPDQWALGSSDGVTLGRALIRRLEVSSALRSIVTPTCLVEVEWNGVFKKWEIRSVASAGAVASSAAVFGSR
jgi:hypothetical protein